MIRITCAYILMLVALGGRNCNAGDWPQLLGPQRNGVAEGEKFPDSLPAEFRPSWTAKLGAGYAGPIVAGGKVLVFHRIENQERLQAFDAATGKDLWQANFPASYRGGIDSDTGPRCAPVVSGDSAIVFGAAADLHCVALADGQKRWTRNLSADYDVDEGYFGAGSTPIVVGNKILLNLGAEKAGLISFDLATGKTLWSRTDENASYSSPTIFLQDGRPQALFVTRYNAMLVQPDQGQTTLLTPFGKRGPTVNAATPLLVGKDHIFLTASYGIGALFGRIEADKLVTLWSNDDTLSSQYVTPVEFEGVLYGIHGREDAGAGELRAVEAKSGRVLWSQADFGIGHLLRAGDRVLLLKTSGELVLFAADPAKYRPLGKVKVAKDTTRAIPAFSNGKLFFRSTSFRGGELVAWDLR